MATTLEVVNAAQLALLLNKPTALLTNYTASQSIPNSTVTAIQFTGALSDNWAGWSSGANTRYTSQVSGLYRISSTVPLGGSAANRRFIYIYVNGVLFAQAEMGGVVNTSTTNVYSAPALAQLNVGDYVETFYFQDSGGALGTTVGTSTGPAMAVEFVRF